MSPVRATFLPTPLVLCICARSYPPCTLFYSLPSSFSCSNRVQPSRSCPHDTRYSHRYTRYTYIHTYITLVGLPVPPLFLSLSLSLSLSLPSGLYGSSRSWFLCMKLRFEPLSWVFAEDTVDRRFDGRWWCSSFAGFLVFYSLVEVDYSFLFRFYRSNRRDFLFSLSILIYSQFIPG